MKRIIISEPKDRELAVLSFMSDGKPKSLHEIFICTNTPYLNAKKCIRYYSFRGYIIFYKEVINWNGKTSFYIITELGLAKLKELQSIS